MQTTRTFALTLTALGLLGAAQTAQAQITGFGSGSAFTRTGYTQDNSGNIVDTNAPTISGGMLTLTTAAASEARAAYATAPQSVGAFVAQFTYRNDPTSEPGLGAADGFTFVLQNQSLTAVGGGGAGLGYGLRDNNQPPSGPALTAITKSASVQFFLRGSTGGGTGFGTGGTLAAFPGTQTGAVNLAGGDPILVTLVYNGITLAETLTDQTIPADTFTTSYVTDIRGAVGGPTALVGFTGGTGGGFSTQTISGFTFAATPEPSQWAAFGLGVLGLTGLSLRARRKAARSR